ncbi:maltose alpha-D-glucosyltransferase [Modestobacter sp. SYSU DS0875]
MTLPVPAQSTPGAGEQSTLPAPGSDPEWFKRAVFYEVLVRGFADSNADGIGDLRGMIGKLDYLQWLGVDCLWLPPFFSSPLRDGGYDVSDYTAVLPEFGDIEDFKELIEAAHSRGMRMIIDFVMNHTSDQHPWFQASRSDPEGPYGDFYVWADDDTGYADARIIFVDTESSNWTFDPVRKQYFWHRFFSHQPDLNFENPKVQEAIIDALRFWLDLGVDGFRLDAVPYLFEEEGTNCENLPRTHEFLKKLRKVVDAEYPDRVLLCEANQWPADVVEYFGENGDECQMAFHFPVMPRLFMGVRREQRFPISEIMAQTPGIPENCQWGIFLRNHDELTLEMVTDEERDYMWDEYAKDPRMKANIGIRRRLAPLLDNDIDTLELFTALLLSLPGSPVLYYGDEIGMGDNIWLGDRDAVRTPMQWTPDRNGGFSTADPQRMHLPLVADPVYGYQVTNVEAQLRNSNSLLHWTRTLIAVRKQHPTFGVGSFTEIGSRNPTVLSFVREFGDDIVLCVNNLSRFPQPVELDLRRFEGYTPVELTGRVQFPQIGVLPYMLTLGGHGFYWFELQKPVDTTPEDEEDWESTTSSNVAQSLLDSGLVSEGAPAGSGGLGGEAPTTTDPEGEA